MPRQKIKMVEVNLALFPECTEEQNLYAAQQDVVDCLEMGESCDCPLCGRVVKPYHRKLTPVIVARLIVLVGEYMKNKEWCSIPTEPKGKNAQFLTLELWGFITKANTVDDDEVVVKPTKDGYDFVRGATDVPSHIFFFNNSQIAVSENRVTVKEALEDKYDYAELMECVPIVERKLKVKK